MIFLKKLFAKSAFALALGIGVMSLSTSAFAASNCPIQNQFSNINWNQQPSAQPLVKGQYFALPALNFQLPANKGQAFNLDASKLKFNCYNTGTKQVNYFPAPQTFVQQPVQGNVQKPVQGNVQVPNQGNVTAPAKDQANQDQSGAAYANEVLSLVNQERAKAGLPALKMDSSLSAVALDKAKDMAQNHYFDHTSPTYGSPFDMMKQYGIHYMTAGENIAMGQRSPQEVMSQWMNSQGHRANILNGSFTKIGIGYYNGYWVQEFIG